MKNRTLLQIFGRVTTATLGAAMLATLTVAPAQAAAIEIMSGPVREVATYGSEDAAIRAAQDDLVLIEQQCLKRDGFIQRSAVRMTRFTNFWARVECGIKR